MTENLRGNERVALLVPPENNPTPNTDDTAPKISTRDASAILLIFLGIIGLTTSLVLLYGWSWAVFADSLLLILVGMALAVGGE